MVGGKTDVQAQAKTLTERDESLWWMAYRDHGAALLRFLASRLRRREDAEELLQETFCRAIRSESRLRDPGRARAYLFAIAHNLLVSHLRRRGPLLFSEIDKGEGSEVSQLRDGSATSPEALRAFSELREKVDGILAGMSRDHGQAFRLAVLEGRSYREIAELEDWSLNRVRINVHRGRKRVMAGLRSLLLVPGEVRHERV